MRNRNVNKARKSMSLTLLLTISAVTLTGCGATGADSPTRNIRQVTDGVEGQSGSIVIRNLYLVAKADGTADLIAYFVNQGMASDAISSIEINGNKAVIDPAQNELINNRPVIFGGPTATAKATFAGINPVAGYRVDVTVNFLAASPVKLNALITE